jgi:MFS family permease
MFFTKATYGSAYRMLCASSFLFFFSFNLIVPELNGYITKMGGAHLKGLIIGLFALAAMISRPLSGRMSDRIGRKSVMIIGALAGLLASFSYPFFHGVLAFLCLRFIHGFSAGFAPTGVTAQVADLVPPERRGEAMGILGMINNIGISLSPALGSEIYAQTQSYPWMFFAAGIAAVANVVMILFLKESLKNRHKMSTEIFKIQPVDVWDMKVSKQATIMLFYVLSLGTILTVAPDIVEQCGLEKKGYFFMWMTLASILTRLLTSRLSDRLGRRRVMLAGLFFVLGADIQMAFVNNLSGCFAAAVTFGIGTGLCSPSIFAWTVDKASKEAIGRAVSTLFIALEFGIFTGSVLSGFVYNSIFANRIWVFIPLSMMTLIGMFITYDTRRLRAIWNNSK